MDEERKEDRNCIECEKGEKVEQRGKQVEIERWTNNKDRKVYNQKKEKEKDLQRE